MKTIREIFGLMASKQVETAPRDVISPAEEKLDFDDATLRGKERFLPIQIPSVVKYQLTLGMKFTISLASALA